MDWLTIHEAAALLRVRVSWIYERTRTNSIPHVKLGKYLRFDRSELIAWVAEFKRDGRRAELAPRLARIRGPDPPMTSRPSPVGCCPVRVIPTDQRVPAWPPHERRH